MLTPCHSFKTSDFPVVALDHQVEFELSLRDVWEVKYERSVRGTLGKQEMRERSVRDGCEVNAR